MVEDEADLQILLSSDVSIDISIQLVRLEPTPMTIENTNWVEERKKVSEELFLSRDSDGVHNMEVSINSTSPS